MTIPVQTFFQATNQTTIQVKMQFFVFGKNVKKRPKNLPEIGQVRADFGADFKNAKKWDPPNSARF